MPTAKPKRRYNPELEREVDALVNFVDHVDNRVPREEDIPLFGVDETFVDVRHQFGLDDHRFAA